MLATLIRLRLLLGAVEAHNVAVDDTGLLQTRPVLNELETDDLAHEEKTTEASETETSKTQHQLPWYAYEGHYMDKANNANANNGWRFYDKAKKTQAAMTEIHDALSALYKKGEEEAFWHDYLLERFNFDTHTGKLAEPGTASWEETDDAKKSVVGGVNYGFEGFYKDVLHKFGFDMIAWDWADAEGDSAKAPHHDYEKLGQYLVDTYNFDIRALFADKAAAEESSMAETKDTYYGYWGHPFGIRHPWQDENGFWLRKEADGAEATEGEKPDPSMAETKDGYWWRSYGYRGIPYGYGGYGRYYWDKANNANAVEGSEKDGGAKATEGGEKSDASMVENQDGNKDGFDWRCYRACFAQSFESYGYGPRRFAYYLVQEDSERTWGSFQSCVERLCVEEGKKEEEKEDEKDDTKTGGGGGAGGAPAVY